MKNIKTTPLLIVWLMIATKLIIYAEYHYNIKYLFTIIVFILLALELVRVGIITYKAFKE